MTAFITNYAELQVAVNQYDSEGNYLPDSNRLAAWQILRKVQDAVDGTNEQVDAAHRYPPTPQKVVVGWRGEPPDFNEGFCRFALAEENESSVGYAFTKPVRK